MRLNANPTSLTPWNALRPDVWKEPIYRWLGFHLHPAQQTIAYSPARFRVVACGRRFGKSMLAAHEAAAYALMGGQVWIVAPIYDLTVPILTSLRPILQRLDAENAIERQVQSPYFRVILKSGGSIEARTAENERNLQGRSLDLLVVDEAASIREQRVWTQYLRPMLIDRLGHALFISTPKAMNWFWDLFVQGSESNRDIRSFQYPSSANPYLPPGELEAIRRDLSEDEIRQELEAEFLPEGGVVFRHLQQALTAIPQPLPEPGHQYVLGADLAKYEDWTVLVVLDVTTRSMVWMERYHQMDWTLQAERIIELCRRYQVVACGIDATGNDHMCDVVRARGIPVTAIKFTLNTKMALIGSLSMAIEYDGLKLLNDPQLVNEFVRFGYVRTPSGNLTARAPEGTHDDIVMATAIAWHIGLPYLQLGQRVPISQPNRPIPRLR